MKLDLNETEKERTDTFLREHTNCCRKQGKLYFSTIGGGITYLITPTGLGDLIVIRCNSCGKEETITDTDCW